MVTTVEVIRDGQRQVEVNAEFQAGARHRVEVPMTRVLADCDTGAMFVYQVAEARVTETTGANQGPCGVAVDADRVISARLLESTDGPHGRVDVIELVGENFVRRYEVTDDGIIVATDYIPRHAEAGFSLRTLSAVVRRGQPDPAMFEQVSLDRAFARPD